MKLGRRHPAVERDLFDLAIAQAAHETGQRCRSFRQPGVVDDHIVADEADHDR
jgi:hypothetical protein